MLVVSYSPHWPEAVKQGGADFVFLDTEHIARDRAELSWMCQTYREMGMPPIVRIPSPDPYAACIVLDGGACGIVAPYVESAGEVRALVGATKLRPLKGKRLAAALEGKEPLDPEIEQYVTRRNAANSLIVNIESVPALENLDALLDVPGLDAVLVGPHDLSCSLAVPEQYRHAKFDAAVVTILEKARAKGLGAGIHFWDGMDKEIDWAKAGGNLIIHSGDITLFSGALREDLDTMRRELGDETVEGHGGDIVV